MKYANSLSQTQIDPKGISPMRLTLLLILITMACEISTAQTFEKSIDINTPIHNWNVTLTDSKSGKPLTDIQVDAQIAVPGESKQVSRLLLSNELGFIRIPLRKGQATILNVRGPGWCYSAGLPMVGELPAKFFGGDPPPPNLEKQVDLKLHPGTEFRGRLLLPDGQPAADVSLIAGVNCNRAPWLSQSYVENQNRVSFSIGDWPNWHARTTTFDDGSFSLTVPPAIARNWLRLSTTRGGWHAIDTTQLEKNNKSHPLVKYAPFEVEINASDNSLRVDESSGVAELGDLRLAKGIVCQGRVVDSNNQPLAGVHLYTSSPRGPLAGRKTVSQADGTFQFMPMSAGTFKLKPDATIRNEKGEKISREVQAVFISQEVTLSENVNPHVLIIKSLPHVDLEFEWVDRRAQKGPVAYYGSFPLTGQVIRPDGLKGWWRGETVKFKRDGKEFLKVKVPQTISQLKIALHPDQKVTPSYHDENIGTATGQVVLDNYKMPIARIIYGDEPVVK